MTIKPTIKIFANIIGVIMVAVSFFYIWRKAEALIASVSATDITSAMVVILLISSVIYSFALILLAIAWNRSASAHKSVAIADMIAIYGRAVLAKYIPGSVFQYASRQLYGAAKGYTQKQMLAASILEIALHIIMASLLAALLSVISGYAVVYGVLCVILCCLLLGFGRYWGMPSYNIAMLSQGIFFFIFALIIMCSSMIFIENIGDAAILTSIFMIAWLAGFVVPFAPGGIGVREAVIVALGSWLAPDQALLIFAVITRLITLLGDIFFGFGSYCAIFAGTRWKRQAS